MQVKKCDSSGEAGKQGRGNGAQLRALSCPLTLQLQRRGGVWGSFQLSRHFLGGCVAGAGAALCRPLHRLAAVREGQPSTHCPSLCAVYFVVCVAARLRLGWLTLPSVVHVSKDCKFFGQAFTLDVNNCICCLLACFVNTSVSWRNMQHAGES